MKRSINFEQNIREAEQMIICYNSSKNKIKEKSKRHSSLLLLRQQLVEEYHNTYFFNTNKQQYKR